jgi:hypothetical protein
MVGPQSAASTDERKFVRVTRFLASVAVSLSTLAMTLVGVTASAAPAGAAAPSCRATANTPDWYGYGTMPEGTGSTVCTEDMSWVRVDLELDKYTAAGWTPVGSDSLITRDTNGAYWFVTTECKGTGSANYATKAKGSALWMSGANQHLINDPGDGSSYRWSSYITLSCGSPPPPPEVGDLCPATSLQAATVPSGGQRSGKIPIC